MEASVGVTAAAPLALLRQRLLAAASRSVVAPRRRRRCLLPMAMIALALGSIPMLNISKRPVGARLLRLAAASATSGKSLAPSPPGSSLGSGLVGSQLPRASSPQERGVGAARSESSQPLIGAAVGSLSDTPSGLKSFITAVDDAFSKVLPLQEQVNAGRRIPHFGEKAEIIIANAGGGDESIDGTVRQAVDGALQVLFLRQLAILRQQTAGTFEKASGPHAISKADRHFVAAAQELLRPGGSWSYEQERSALRSQLELSLRRDAELTEEKALSARTQQTTIDVISKLQSQMEAVQRRSQGMRAGSPWALSSSYRIPNTPIQIVGRYQQGRANVELNLSPDKDPMNSEAGFVSGLGPANLGVSFNVGV